MTRQLARCVRPALMLGVAIVVLAPSTALGDIRTAVGTDPPGDSAGAPDQDLVAGGAQYDTSGELTVTATVAGDIPSAPASLFTFTVAASAAPGDCTTNSVTLTGATDAPSAAAVIAAVPAPVSAASVVSGSSISFTLSGPAIQNRAWTCMTVAVSSSQDGATVLDQFAAPIFFAGFQPDGGPSDGTGKADREAPKGDLDGKKTQKLGSTVAVSVVCLDEPCRSSTDGTVAVPRSGASARVHKIRKVTRALAKGRKTRITLKLPAAAVPAIRSALARGARVTVLLKIVVADAAGNRRTLRRNIKLTS